MSCGPVCDQHYMMKSSLFSGVCFAIQIDWAANIRKSWDFSEEGAHVRLEAFLRDGEILCGHCKYIAHCVWRKSEARIWLYHDSPTCPRCVQVWERIRKGWCPKYQLSVPIPSLWSAQPSLAIVGRQRCTLSAPKVPTQTGVEGFGLLAADIVSWPPLGIPQTSI